MNVKTLKTYLIILGLVATSIMMSGCSEKVYVDRPVEVKVPQKVALPKVQCYAGQATYTEEIKEMRLCIERYKEVHEMYGETKRIINEK